MSDILEFLVKGSLFLSYISFWFFGIVLTIIGIVLMIISKSVGSAKKHIKILGIILLNAGAIFLLYIIMHDLLNPWMLPK